MAEEEIKPTEHEPWDLRPDPRAESLADLALIPSRMVATEVFLVEADCGSYYCNGHHPVGVFTDRGEAEKVAENIGQVPHADPGYKSPLTGEPGAFTSASVVPLPLNKAVVDNRLQSGCH